MTGTTVLCILGILAGLCIAAFGALEVFGGGMSDAPAEGAKMSGRGCAAVVVGLLLLVASVLGLVL